MPNNAVSAARLRELAVRAHVDPRTIAKEIRAASGKGSRARGDAGDRAREVLRAAGLLPNEVHAP